MVVVLCLSCNFDVVLRGGEDRVYLRCLLGSPEHWDSYPCSPDGERRHRVRHVGKGGSGKAWT